MEKELVVCKIDGLDVFCESDWTIMKAAQTANIQVPALCYTPDLSVVGSCRICVVEIEGETILYPSCSTLVKNNMVIYTHSEKVNYARKIVLEMILSQHLADCLVCDASGECLLEKYSYDFGATGKMFQKAQFNPIKHGDLPDNSLIKFERTKCILCGKCIRACNEWTHKDALSFVDKGEMMRVSTLYDRSLEDNGECIFCGNCINVCPTGALWEKGAAGRGRFPDIRKVKTICPYCGVGCGIEVSAKGNSIIKVRGDMSSPVSKGRLCIKGSFGFDFVNSPQRLVKPLIRNDKGELEETNMIDALIYIKNKIDEIKRNNGVFAGLASARCTNEDNYIFQKFMRSVLHTDNVDHCARICHSPSVSGLNMTLGHAAMTNPIEDIDAIDCFFVIGSNMTSTHPVISWRMIRRIKEGALLIIVDPKKSPLSKYATMHLQLNPGTDMALLYAMMKIIIDEGMQDTDMLDSRCEGVDEFIAEINKLNLEDMIQQTGLDEADIRLATRLFAISGASSMYYAMGITQHVFGTGNVVALADLALLCGKIGQGPTGINPLRGQNNVQGACDMGALTGVLPGYRSINNKADNKEFSKFWDAVLPEKKGLTLNEIMHEAAEGNIDFLYIMGENPVISDPDSNSIIKALEKTDFVVVQDIFLTETAAFADVILPATSFAEKDGTFTNTERRVQRVRKVIDPPSKDMLDDYQIIYRLAELCGANWKYNSWIDVFEEIRKVAPIYSHIDPNKFDDKEFFWPGDILGDSVKRLHQGEFSRGRAKLIYFPLPEYPYKVTPSFPYLLIIGRLYEHYHTGTMTRKSKGIEKLQSEPFVYINPKDAIKLHIKDNDFVKLISDTGEIELKSKLTLDIKPGNLYTTFHFHEAVVNKLTNKRVLDAQSKMAAMKVVMVNIIRK